MHSKYLSSTPRLKFCTFEGVEETNIILPNTGSANNGGWTAKKIKPSDSTLIMETAIVTKKGTKRVKKSSAQSTSKVCLVCMAPYAGRCYRH